MQLIQQIPKRSTLIRLDTVGKDYTYRDAFDLTSTVIAPCGTTSVLNINSALQVSNAANRTGRGLMATDSVRSIYFICVLLLNFQSSRRLIPISSRYLIQHFLTTQNFDSLQTFGFQWRKCWAGPYPLESRSIKHSAPKTLFSLLRFIFVYNSLFYWYPFLLRQNAITLEPQTQTTYILTW